ncbi:MAG: FAD-dependent oxidoreductase [Planctomycetaceae bacterium]|nr:FAD-dependent oxidoreductase [Planctomycetaceae bacterium]
MRIPRIGIVGGGPGGLFTAWSLQTVANAPIDVTIFEATSRLGGKIVTKQFDSADVPFEAGAAEFYDYSQFGEDPLKELVLELGLPISRMGGSAVISGNHVISNLDDVRETLGQSAYREMREFDRVARDEITPQEFYYSDDPEGCHERQRRGQFVSVLDRNCSPRTRRFIEHQIHSDLAAEPAETSLHYGLQNYLMNDPAYMQLYGIVGGNEQLPQELARRINAQFQLNTRVEEIRANGPRSYTVVTKSGGHASEQEFDFVIIALPHNQLQSVTYRGGKLNEAMQSHFEHYNFPAHYLRMTLLFSEQFWRHQLADSYWMLDQFGGCCLYDESSRIVGTEYGILGWLLGGDVAKQMCAESDDQLIAAALDSLPDFLCHGREYFLEGRVHRWDSAVNALPGGLQTLRCDLRHQPSANHTGLFVVGDYLYDSTLNGVMDSAEYVAGWIAALIAEPTTQS